MQSAIATVEALPLNGMPRGKTEQLAWAKEFLGPDPGKWDGYQEIADEETAKKAWGVVGTIHGYTTKVGRDIVTIGEHLLELKELLPHGQFTACVKAEFGWSPDWAQKLMGIARRFANTESTRHLPSSAEVLYELATAGADDETVQRAADEGWTVKETRRQVGRAAGKPAAPRPIEHQALTLFRKQQLSEVETALALARQITTVTDASVLQEVGLRELPKGKLLQARDADFHRRPDGSGWDRIPHAGRLDVAPDPEPARDVPQQETLLPAVGGDCQGGEVLTMAEAAQRLGIQQRSLTVLLIPSKSPNGLIRSGWRVTREGRGKVRFTPVN